MKCPGQDTQFWTENAIFDAACPQCSKTVEFFKDDTTRKCGHCGHRFVNPKMDFGCAAYCSYAEQCLGDLPPELVAQKEDLLKDRVAVAVKRHFKTDFKRIGRAVRRARHAEEIGKAVRADLPLLLMAAYLWDLGQGDPAANARLAENILAELKAPQALIDQVCAMVGRRSAVEDSQRLEDKIAADADGITLLEDIVKEEPLAVTEMDTWILKHCSTAPGRAYARNLLKR